MSDCGVANEEIQHPTRGFWGRCRIFGPKRLGASIIVRWWVWPNLLKRRNQLLEKHKGFQPTANSTGGVPLDTLWRTFPHKIPHLSSMVPLLSYGRNGEFSLPCFFAAFPFFSLQGQHAIWKPTRRAWLCAPWAIVDSPPASTSWGFQVSISHSSVILGCTLW